MNTRHLLEWYNLIFLVPGGLAIVLLLLSSAMSLGADADGDTDGETDTDADADGETEAESDGGDGGFGAHMLHYVGVGKAPLTLVLGALLLGWGFTGFWANQLLSRYPPSSKSLDWLSIPLALIGAITLSRTTSEIAAYFVPKIETAAVMRESLVGQEASVVYPISETGGRAFYYDKNAVLHDVTCRVRPGEAGIGKGRKVILVGYEEDTKRFWVEPSPFDDDQKV